MWEEVDFEKRKIYVQYDTTNSELEAEADKLLGKTVDSDDVAQGDWDEDISADQIKAQLGLDGEDDDDGEGGRKH
jgi:hypothetical protein